MDYGPGGEISDGLNRYWLWDYGSNSDSHTLGLTPQQIVDLQVLGEVFSPADFGVQPWHGPSLGIRVRRPDPLMPGTVETPLRWRPTAPLTVGARLLAGRRDGPKPHPPSRDVIVNDLRHWNQQEVLDLTTRVAKERNGKPEQQEVDEITVWWQRTLGREAVLGQASNRPPPGPRALAPTLSWTKPEGEHVPLRQPRT